MARNDWDLEAASYSDGIPPDDRAEYEAWAEAAERDLPREALEAMGLIEGPNYCDFPPPNEFDEDLPW